MPDNVSRAARLLLLLAGVLLGDVSLAGPISVDALRNASYPSGFATSGEIRLRGGEYQRERRSEVRVVLTDHIALGTMADGTGAAAVVLRTTTGGNAVFHELTLMVDGEQGLRWQATAPLGDRVVIDGIALDKGEVILTLRAHSADDAMCCPSVRTETRFAIRGARLVARTTR